MEQSFLVPFQEVKVALRTEVDLNNFFWKQNIVRFLQQKGPQICPQCRFSSFMKNWWSRLFWFIGWDYNSIHKSLQLIQTTAFLGGENIFWAKSVYNMVFWILKNLYVELDFSYLILFYFYFYFVFAPLWSLPWRGRVACMFQWTWRLCWLELCLLVGPPMSDRRRCRNQTKSVHWLWHAGIQ